MHNYSGVVKFRNHAKFPMLRKFSFVAKFRNPCKNFCVLLLAPVSPLIKNVYTNCKNKYKKKITKIAEK